MLGIYALKIAETIYSLLIWLLIHLSTAKTLLWAELRKMLSTTEGGGKFADAYKKACI